MVYVFPHIMFGKGIRTKPPIVFIVKLSLCFHRYSLGVWPLQLSNNNTKRKRIPSLGKGHRDTTKKKTESGSASRQPEKKDTSLNLLILQVNPASWLQSYFYSLQAQFCFWLISSTTIWEEGKNKLEYIFCLYLASDRQTVFYWFSPSALLILDSIATNYCSSLLIWYGVMIDWLCQQCSILIENWIHMIDNNVYSAPPL